MKRFSSLKYRITFLIMACVLIISIIIIGYNAYILKMKDERVSRSLESTLSLYCDEISVTLDNVESFLLTKCFVEEDIKRLSQPREETDRYLAILKIKNEFSKSIGNYNMLDGLFLYDAGHDIFIAQAKDGGTKEVRDNLVKITSTFDLVSQKGDNTWFSVLIGGEYYFIKVYRLQQIYVASYLKVSTIIGSLPQIVLAKNDYALMCDGEGKILDRRLQYVPFVLQGQERVRIRGKSYDSIQVASKSKAFSFAILESRSGIFRDNNLVWSQFILVVLGTIIIAGISVYFIKSKFTLPITNLIDAMNQLKAGNLEVNLSAGKQFDEFQIVNETFDEMSREIKKLKIDVYEEMLNKQKVELLYLQEQINPHFLTNCMNLIRNLSIVGDNKKIEEASILISKYMRYTFTVSGMITIERELEHVKNYETLQRMRFGNQMDIWIKADPELLQQEVPIMLIQTFVDNALKHQLDPDLSLRIKIVIERWVVEGECQGIAVLIADNGDGFSNEILEKLQRHEKIVNEVGDHIGIYNVCQRLDILYDKKALINFFNENGACVSIYLPERRKQKMNRIGEEERGGDV
ncbi:MAG: two-component system, sensor histidine kinase YesM [Clostridiales bacterium]|nr:two-component system, sensor histidine kinase YesM [Clostridiales bacterium]